jgi:uncharacterized protein with von Willebrand factor type A (vWA) domain
MDYIKESFQRVKEDIFDLKNEINFLNSSLKETREKMIEICEIVKKMNEKTDYLMEKEQQTHSTQRQEIQTTSTHPSTHDYPFKPLNDQNIGISTGNEGVSTDRQTDRQTDNSTQKQPKIQRNAVDNAVEILDSLDNLKKEIRLKFKRITDQELRVFSTIYQTEEELGHSDYKTVAERINLTESSVRDYVGRLIEKGIPVEKRKINNKNIHLFISTNLKKIAPLNTILQLRDL